jgi:hypothetical protein
MNTATLHRRHCGALSVLALLIALASPAVQADEHAHAIEGMPEGFRRMPTSKTRGPTLNVVFTPESKGSWYLGTSPVRLVNGGSKIGSVFAAGYSGKAGTSLQYELRLSREKSAGARIQFAAKF